MKAVYLTPRGPYRHELHSDTLFGLLCWGIRQVHSERQLVELLAEFAAGRPPFLVSSAFLFQQQSTTRVHFLPRPILRPEAQGRATLQETQRRKRYRRLRWIPVEHFNGFLQGRYGEDGYYTIGEWAELTPPAVERVDRLRARIDRLASSTTGGGTLYTTPEYWLDRGGFYFLLKGEASALVESCLSFLADFGWGGGNSVGQASFAVEVAPAPLLEEPANADRFVTLSLYCPHTEELGLCQGDGAWYELVRRKGKVGGHFLQAGDFWKRALMMFAPGSSFPLIAGREVYGSNPVVKGRSDGLPFDVQQLGYAFSVKMKTAME